ncbi:hypothetical protein OEZ86_001561 [Tetradesmus obliquus]|nr:hypothetical protein OEZ86_001561 [Tetradesmus obliquus]
MQTSALISNSCGYCGTRNTSGCWRRGWEIGPNRFINLCNKCGLRHKAGKLQSVPLPSPPQRRNIAAAANGSTHPSRPGSRGNPAAAAAAAGAVPVQALLARHPTPAAAGNAAGAGGMGVGLKRGRTGSGGSNAAVAAAAAAAGGRGGMGGSRQELVARQMSTRQVSPAMHNPSSRPSGNLPATPATPSPRGWSAEQLHAWLHAGDCGEAVRAFRDQGIDGPAMAGLLRVAGGGEAGRLYELLGSDVGVQAVGLRLRLVECIMLHFGGAGRRV